MKLTNKTLSASVALLLIAIGGSATYQGTQAARPSAPSALLAQASDHGAKIDSKYDGFNHETIVTLNKMRITCGSVEGNFKDACVSLVAELHCPGIQLNYVRYARLQLVFQTKDWTQRHPMAERQLSVVAGSETLRLGQMKLISQSLDELMTEVLEVDVPYAVFKKIALAPVVDVKVGNNEFELRPKNLSALRDLNNRVKF